MVNVWVKLIVTADVFSKQKRSQVMAAIKQRGNRSTEEAIKRLMRRGGLHGWRSHPSDVFGMPDFVFRQERLAIFADGCFWHGCRKCRLRDRAATNREFWSKKILMNIRRDQIVNRTLRRTGWQVLRLWEHDIEKHPERCHDLIARLLGRSQAGSNAKN